MKKIMCTFGREISDYITFVKISPNAAGRSIPAFGNIRIAQDSRMALFPQVPHVAGFNLSTANGASNTDWSSFHPR